MALSSKHRQLFAAYTTELKAAADKARVRFDAAVADAIHEGLVKDEAQQSVLQRRGPAAAEPRVLGIIIQYFFRCLQLNEELQRNGEAGHVEPLVFVQEMLSGSHEELWDFLAELPYLPIGLSKDRKYI